MRWNADPDLGPVAYRHPRHYATVTPGPPPAPRDGTRLRRLRREMRMTQGDLARRIGTRPGEIGRWERGDTPVPARVLAALGLTTQTGKDSP
ncbi:helix-turn-helix transcriptional regulator [Micromonospora sp. Llam7]|uniref:helix-turn-helix domain-containing protein n=1 Tax=Micromonospora tarapacensis TaxID=2835305 RepID=UPI001C82F087|nr:helix-turn-helix transcriptional regulator [Micromonospora tarapacensis]